MLSGDTVTVLSGEEKTPGMHIEESMLQLCKNTRTARSRRMSILPINCGIQLNTIYSH